MEKRDLLYEGKAKKVFKTDNEKALIVSYKDDATAFNGLKKGTIANKGIINNRMTNFLFKKLEESGIETHLIEEINDRDTIVKKVEIVPLEVIIRNIAAGSFSKKYGVEEGKELKCTVLEFSYKNDELGDPLLNLAHAYALELVTPEEAAHISKMAYHINDVLKKFFIEKNLILVDFKIEFGRYDGRIILADEISPDTCRLWDKDTKEKLDKDRFRRDMGNVEDAYIEVAKRIGLV
jgi:phosphoribosylaminoimidazole-succinocarboxamide synthase